MKSTGAGGERNKEHLILRFSSDEVMNAGDSS